MFKQMVRPLLGAVIAPSLLAVSTQPAHAYNGITHARIAELAVRSMSEIDHGSLPAPIGEEQVFAAYLAAIQGSPEKLVLLRVGLPRRQGDNSSIEGGAYPFDNDSTICQLYDDAEPLNLNKIEAFRIADLRYLPKRDAQSCKIVPPVVNDPDADRYSIEFEGSDEDPPEDQPRRRPVDPAALQRRVLEVTLGVHATSPDYHLHDTTVWVRPTSAGALTIGFFTELGSSFWEVGAGTLLLPFVCAYNAVFGSGCDVDDSFDLARRTNPVEFLEGWIPGAGSIQDSDFSSIWHFVHAGLVESRYNDVPGMYYPNAGPVAPGALDVAIMSGSFMSGLTLRARRSNGTEQYGQYDRLHRHWIQWQAHPIGVTEFSPIHHLARFGWERFLSGGALNAGDLSWPLHALGDAAAPHHVVATTAWGHRPFEEHVDHDRETFLPAANQTAQRAQLERIALKGFRWWKQFSVDEDVAELILGLAFDTRNKLFSQGDWPYYDWSSTVWQSNNDDGERLFKDNVMNATRIEQTRDLLEESAGATLAFLAVAASHIGPGAPRGDIDCPPGETFSVRAPGGPGCTDNPGGDPPLDNIEEHGIESVSPPTPAPGGECIPYGQECTAGQDTCCFSDEGVSCLGGRCVIEG